MSRNDDWDYDDGYDDEYDNFRSRANTRNRPGPLEQHAQSEIDAYMNSGSTTTDGGNEILISPGLSGQFKDKLIEFFELFISNKSTTISGMAKLLIELTKNL